MLDSLWERQDKIKLVSPRHEQTAGHMADAYFRIAHKPVATLTSCGPGSCNLVMATACASAGLRPRSMRSPRTFPHLSSIADRFRRAIGTRRPSFRWCCGPMSSAPSSRRASTCCRSRLRQSYNLMLSGRPGPVNLDVPFNLFQEEDDVEMPRSDRAAGFARPGASPEDIRRVVDLILAAERPAFFVSHGVTLAEAGPELTARRRAAQHPGHHLAERDGRGAHAASARARFHRSQRHLSGQPGRPALRPADRGGRALRRPLVLVVDSRLLVEHPADPKLVHVDIDPSEIGRNYPVELGITRRCEGVPRRSSIRRRRSRGIASGSASRAGSETIDGWRQRMAGVHQPATSMRAARRCGPSGSSRRCASALPDDAIISLDSGVHHNWFMQFWEARRPQAMLNSWGFSAMGFGRQRHPRRQARRARTGPAWRSSATAASS